MSTLGIKAVEALVWEVASGAFGVDVDAGVGAASVPPTCALRPWDDPHYAVVKARAEAPMGVGATVHRCGKCRKAFVDERYLDRHIERRHLPPPAAAASPLNQPKRETCVGKACAYLPCDGGRVVPATRLLPDDDPDKAAIMRQCAADFDACFPNHAHAADTFKRAFCRLDGAYARILPPLMPSVGGGRGRPHALSSWLASGFFFAIRVVLIVVGVVWAAVAWWVGSAAHGASPVALQHEAVVRDERSRARAALQARVRSALTSVRRRFSASKMPPNDPTATWRGRGENVAAAAADREHDPAADKL